MDPGYRERQGYYDRDPDPQLDLRHHQQQQHQLQPQQPQLLQHYAHQLSHHQSLLQPHLSQHQLHHSQPAYLLGQGDQGRQRDDYASRHGVPAVLQQMVAGTGQIVPTGIRHSHHATFTEHTHQQLPHINATSQASYSPPSSTTQPSASMIDQPDNSQAYVSPESPPQPQDSPEEVDMMDEANEMEDGDAKIQEEIPPVVEPQHHENTTPTPNSSVDVDTPKKRAVRLALAETQQQNSQPTQSLSLRGPPSSRDIWKPDLPIGLSFMFSPDGRKIAGVRAERCLEKGAKFGPFNGKLVDEAVGSLRDSAWEICVRGKVFFYVDGQSKSHNNWMAFMESANNEEEQNFEAYQTYGDVYFRTTKVIEPGSELKVFYSEEYANHVGFKSKLSELTFKKEIGSFPCSSCDRSYPTAKRLLRHLKISHDPDRASEMRPVLTWEPRIVSENAENEKPAPAKPAKPTPPPAKTSPVVSERRSGVVDERFICTTCGKNFPTRGRLAAHETFHEYSTEHSCPICAETFSNSNNLAKHMVTHKAKPFKCQSCGNSFTTRNMLSRHERLSHTFNHRCRVCGMLFVKKRECNRHEKMHPDWKNFKPVRSGARKQERWNKIVHSDDELEEGEFVFLPPPEDEVEIGLEEDEEANPNLPKDMLGKRINYYDRPRPYKCRFCPKRYLSRKAQLDHEAERHTKRCRYKCTHCPSVFATEIRYVEHVKRHVENRPFQCQHCPSAFASESALKNHQGEHTGLKPVKCDICGKGFRTRHFMTAHKRRMHKVQQMRFACSFCNKPFSDKGNLIKHERRHKGIRPYVCLVCGRGFTSNYCLTSHSYTHTKEKHFSCPHCDQKFTLNQHLTNHIYRDHTSNRKDQENSGAQQPEDPASQQLLAPASQQLMAPPPAQQL